MSDLFSTLFGAIAAPLFLLAGLGMMYYVFSLIGVDPTTIIALAIAASPIWLPSAIFYILFEQWMDFVHKKFALDNGRTTLRIKLPQEVFKSPETMESVIAQIHNPNGADNLWQTYIDGKHPLNFSFELVSFGGEVRFYINVPTKKTKNAVEAQLYAQYPGIEVVEEPIDYTAEIQWNPDKYEMMSFHIVKKDDDVLPIKTYIDFGMDKLPKEEQKFEPMAAMLEQLGKAKPHERIWIQIIARPHAKGNFKTGHLQPKDTWEGKALKKIDEMLGRESKSADPENPDAPTKLTTGERDTITAIERNIGKYAYEVGIRWMYITEKGKFNGDFIGPMIRTFAQYDIIKRNGLGVRWRTDFDYNWFSDWSGKRKLALKKKELAAYKRREYSEGDKKSKVDARKIMSAEELATIYHIPGSSVVTPGLTRITSARREPPANLPTGLPQTI
jgi:hypothetical protein